MTEPQVWGLIGVFAAALFSVITLQTTMLVRVIRTEIGRLDIRIDALDAKLSTKIDHLDRDVQFLMNRQFGEPTDREQ